MTSLKRIGVALLGALVLLCSTGINVFEHICNTEHFKVLALVKVSCDNDSIDTDCCSKDSHTIPKKKKNCCEDKTFFVKADIQNYFPKITDNKTYTYKNTPLPQTPPSFATAKYIAYKTIDIPIRAAYSNPPVLLNTSYRFLCIMRC